MGKKLLTGIIFILCIILLGSSKPEMNQKNIILNPAKTAQAVNVDKHKTANMLTVDDIKKMYDDGEKGQLVDIKTFGDYALAEYIDHVCIVSYHNFDLYNMASGDMDTLPIWPYNVRLYSINSPDDIEFITDGMNNTIGPECFPQMLRCVRTNEGENKQGGFCQEVRNLYLGIDNSVEMGLKCNETIADIKVSPQGIELKFGPMKGYEEEFYSGCITIPYIKTSYDKDKNQLVIRLYDTDIDNKIKKLSINEQNQFLKSIAVKEDGSDSLLIIDLKDTAKYYTIRSKEVEDVKDGLPYLDVKFVREYKMQ